MVGRVAVRFQQYYVVKLVVFEENCDSCLCLYCDKPYTDAVYHYIMSCEYLLSIRTSAWDTILEFLDCESEVRLVSRGDERFLDTLLSLNWSLFKDYEQFKDFVTISAKELINLMQVL